MHFEVFVEDQSGAALLDVLVPRIIGEGHTHRLISYKGIGHLPKNMVSAVDVRHRMLLDRLPDLLRGYAATLRDGTLDWALIVVCDLDSRCLSAFRRELLDVLARQPMQVPKINFCIAVEEMEAWLLGDPQAVQRAYPKAKSRLLNDYLPDSIIGTWEALADAVYVGGCAALRKRGSPEIGRMKSEWAKTIAPHIDIEANRSPSFQYFRRKLRALAV